MKDLNKGKILYWPSFSKKHYYLIIFAVFSLLRRAVPFIIEYFGEIEVENFNKSCFFDMLSNFSADFLVGGYKLYLYMKERNKKKKKMKNENNNKNEKLIDNNDEYSDKILKKKLKFEKGKIKQKTEMKQKFCLIMLIISVVDTVSQLCLLVFSYIDEDGCTLNFNSKCRVNNNKPKINEDDLIFTVAINIFFRYIFSRFLLTLYIYLHDLVSIVITIISFIPLITFNLITLYKSERSSEMIDYILLNIVMTILFAFEDVMNKVALDNLVIRSHDLMFYKALFQIPLFTIVFVIVYLKDIDDPSHSIKSYLFNIFNDKKLFALRIFYRLSFIISNIFRTLSLIRIIKILSPNDLSILKSLEFVVLSLLSMIKDLFYSKQKNEIKFYIIELICCIFLFIASCLSNEIFVINRCSLAKYTKFYKWNNEPKFDDEINEVKEILKNENNEENPEDDDENE